MKKFLYKAALFSLIVLSAFFYIAFHNRPQIDLRNDYMAAIIDKHKLLEKNDSNRILLVGGSNLAFGINSEKIEKTFNRPVVNLALHAGLGLDFIMNEAIAEVKKGDVVLLNIEYALYNPESEPDIELIDHVQRIYPASKAYYTLNLKNRETLLYGNFKKSFTHVPKDTLTVYNRKSFDAWGDVTAHLGKKKTPKLKGSGKWNKINSIYTSKFKELSDQCKITGAKVFLLFPNYTQSDYDLNKLVISDVEAQVKEKIQFIPLLNTPETFVFPDSCFYDTNYHLNGSGREIRTDKLIEILKENTVILED